MSSSAVLLLTLSVLASLWRVGIALPAAGDCVVDLSANNVAVNTELRVPVPSSFHSCIPTADPNALVAQNHVAVLRVNGSVTDLSLLFELNIFGLTRIFPFGPCQQISGDPVMQSECGGTFNVGENIALAAFILRFNTPPTQVSYVAQALRPTDSRQCAPGFGTEEPTCPLCVVGIRPLRGRCTVVCAADEFTDVNICKKCPQGSVPNSDQSGCDDIDECLDGSAICPANSACENSDVLTTNILFRCICSPGYVVQGTESREGSSTSTCVETSITIAVVDLVPRAIQFSFTASGVSLYRAEIFALDQTNRQFRVFSEKTPGDTIVDTLVPGTRYQIKAIVLDVLEEDTELVSFATFETPCTCQNESASAANGNGKPTDLVASQNNGMITFSFVDQSQCELAYSLSRRVTGTVNSVVFAPDYYYTAASTCGEVYNPVSVVL